MGEMLTVGRVIPISSHQTIQPMSELAIEKVRLLETEAAKRPQRNLLTEHLIHGGMYARTLHIPAGVMITGALVKLATVLIISGDVVMYAEDGPQELHGYNVLAASANRKQAFVAVTDTSMTMILPSDAKTVEAAEAQVTDETGLLMTRGDHATNKIMVTGE